MYTACLFCNEHLGRNERIESFPVGRRLAFDAARGRLWVICPHCTRWNLTPLDERWEAIESCERHFRQTRLRISVENIGIAHLPDGLELVRIGPALRAEIAAWRYGRNFVESFSRHHAMVALGEGIARDTAGAIGSLFRSLPRRRPVYGTGLWFRLRTQPNRLVDAVDVGAGDRALIQYRHLDGVELVRPEANQHLHLMIRHEQGELALTGGAALRLASKMLAIANGRHASADDVGLALRKLEHAGDPESYFSRIAALALRTSWGRRPNAPHVAAAPLAASTPAERLALHLTSRAFWARGAIGSAPRAFLLQLSLVDRLALEMAAHEDSERRAMRGELSELEAAWREAEEIAAIADGMFLESSAERPGAPSETGTPPSSVGFKPVRSTA